MQVKITNHVMCNEESALKQNGRENMMQLLVSLSVIAARL